MILLAGCRAEPIRNLGCDAVPAVEAGLRAAEQLRDRCAQDEACWDRALAEARVLRDRFPEELGAHRAYVRSFFRGMQGEYGAAGKSVVAEYRQRLAERPDDAALLYLQALLTEKRSERRELLQRSMARADDFAWPHHSLAIELAWRPEAEAKLEAQQQGEKFVAMCPDRLPEIQRLVGALDDSALFERYRERFAAAFRPEFGRFAELATLWQQSFQFAPPERHAALRAAMVPELSAVAAEGRIGDRAWLSALELGYRLTGDAGGVVRAEDLQLAQLPCEPRSVSIRQRRFLKEQPRPVPDSAAFDGWRHAQLSTVDALVESCPASGLVRFWELSALAELDEIPAPRFVAAGLALAAALDVQAHPSNPAAAAKRFLERGVGIEQVAALLEKDREEMEFAQERARMFVESPEEMRSLRAEELLRLAGHLVLQIELAILERTKAKSEELLSKLEEAVDAARKDASDEIQKRVVASTLADAWRLKAKLAETQEDSAAALAAYGQAIASAPSTEALRTSAEAAFARLYGGTEGFPAWVAGAERAREAAMAASEPQVHQAAPDFRWPDLTGRHWTPADMRGKAVLLNFWATWCGPCVAEMPYVAKLAQRFRDDPRVLIVGVNVDESPGLVQPFVAKREVSYPILFGGAKAWEDWRLVAIPRNLVLDTQGRIEPGDLVFEKDGDRWVETVAARLLETAERQTPRDP